MKLGKPNFGHNLVSFSQKIALAHFLNQMTSQLHAKTLKRLTIGSREKFQTKRTTSKQANGKKRTKICRVFHRSLILWVQKITLPKGDEFPNSAKVSNRFILNISLYIYDKAFCKYN